VPATMPSLVDNGVLDDSSTNEEYSIDDVNRVRPVSIALIEVVGTPTSLTIRLRAGPGSLEHH
jgi:hypothetical protein